MTRIEITITQSSAHTGTQRHSVSTEGDGGLDQYIDAIRAALVAMSFTPQTAARLKIVEGCSDANP